MIYCLFVLFYSIIYVENLYLEEDVVERTRKKKIYGTLSKTIINGGCDWLWW
jgi:hypothetical protein